MKQEIYYKNYEEKPIKLSIVTATWNAENFLPRAIKSLQQQTDKDFEWIVSDGASTDGTLEILKKVEGINIKIISKEDFGIYDALNRGIKSCNGEFYLVIGADDELYPNAVKDYKESIEDDVDIITAWIDVDCGISKAGKAPIWLYSLFNHYITGHAVGSIYCTKLHEKFGYYSRKFPIAADQLFVGQVLKAGSKVKIIKNVVGRFSNEGLSGNDTIGCLTESYRINIILGENKFLQTILFLLRLFKNFGKLK